MTTQTTPTPQTNTGVQMPLSYGFQQTFRNWKFWIPIAGMYILVSVVTGGVSGFITGTDADTVEYSNLSPESSLLLFVVSIISAVLSMVLSAFIYRSALRQVDSGKTPPLSEPPSFGNCTKDIKWKNYIFTAIVLAVLMFIFAAVFIGLVALSATIGISVLMGIVVVLVFLLIIFVMPFFSFAPIAALDGYSVKQAITVTFKSVKAHYWKVVGNIVLLFLILFGVYILSILTTLLFSYIHPTAGLLVSMILSLTMSFVILPVIYLVFAKLYDEITPRSSIVTTSQAGNKPA